jgi:hypothetical protein
MTRRLLNLLAVASLAAVLGAAGVWVRSYFSDDALRWQRSAGPPGDVTTTIYDLGWRRGVFRLGRMVLWKRDHEPPSDWQYARYAYPLGPPGTGAAAEGRFGFYFFSKTQTYDSARGATRRVDALRFPLWLPVVMGSILPAVVARSTLRRRAERRRDRAGLCRRCGYDLRGSPGGRCPECGTTPQGPA